MSSTNSKSQRITINDVAKQARVSTATVSRVLNQSGKVSSETIAVVMETIDHLGYQPNRAAQVLASSRTHALGVLVDEITGDYMLSMIYGIEVETHDAGYEFMINSTRRRLVKGGYPVNETNTDGLIVFANSVPNQELQRLHDLNFPVVLLACTSPPNLSIPYVTMRNKSGAYEMAKYLIETRGYRKFAFLRGPEEQEDTIWRELGYQKALTEHNLDYSGQLIGEGRFNEEVSYETVTQWIRRGLDMEVIVAFDDTSAIGAMAALRDANIQIPDQVAVVGFDDIRLVRYLDPPLTSVRVPVQQAAQTAVQQLIRLIETGEAETEILLPTELIIRRSCGCC